MPRRIPWVICAIIASSYAELKRTSLAQALQYVFVCHRDQGGLNSHLLLSSNIVIRARVSGMDLYPVRTALGSHSVQPNKLAESTIERRPKG